MSAMTADAVGPDPAPGPINNPPGKITFNHYQICSAF